MAGPGWGSQLRAPPSAGAVGGGGYQPFGHVGGCYHPPAQTRAWGVIAPAPRVGRHAHCDEQRLPGVPGSSRQPGARRSGCSLSCVTSWWLHLAPTVAPLLLWSTIFFLCSTCLLYFQLVSCGGLFAPPLRHPFLCLPPHCPPVSFFIVLFNRHRTPLRHCPPLPARAGVCLPVCDWACPPRPPPASLATAWPGGPDAGRAAHGRSLRRGWLSP